MTVYVESSAILAWLLGEPAQTAVLKLLTGADRVVSSSLTAVECARGLARARAARRLSATDELAALRLLEVAESNWDVYDLSDRVLDRSRGTFPAEPLRTSDALHLSTALLFQEVIGPVALLSLDERVRQNAEALGFQLLPA
jgi:predicted nucleic acid-binding protein